MDVQITDTQVLVNGKVMLDMLDNKVTSSNQLERIAQQFINARYPEQVREKIIRTGEGKAELDAYLKSIGQFKALVQAKLNEKVAAIQYEKYVSEWDTLKAQEGEEAADRIQELVALINATSQASLKIVVLRSAQGAQ